MNDTDPATVRPLFVAVNSGSTATNFYIGPHGDVKAPTITVERSTPPTPALGMIYFNSVSNHFYGWNGSNWKQLDN